MSDNRGTPYEDVVPTGGATPATAERRVALVIGNARYDHGNVLANPHNDAAAIADMLSRLGFALHGAGSKDWHPDLGLRQMRRVLAGFSRAADAADMAVVYFAGHGMEFGGVNYLLPRDCEPNPDSRIMQADSITLDEVLGFVKRARMFRMVILDACRVNEFDRRDFGTLASRGGLVDLKDANLDNMLVVYAARHGEPALDGHGDKNSPFAKALIEHLETPDTDVELLIRRVCDSVRKATSGRQVPHKYGYLGGEPIYLKRTPVATTQSPTPLESATGPSPEAARLHAAAAWPEVRDGRNPARLARFEQHFAGTWFAEEARHLREEIEAEATRRAEEEAAAKARQAERASLKLAYRTEYWKTKDDGRELRRIFVWVEGPDTARDAIAKVVYTLDPSFKEPMREVTQRDGGFLLQTNGWGGFEIKAVAHFRDGGASQSLATNINFDPLPMQPASAASVSASGNFFTNPTVTVNQSSLRERRFEVRVGDGKNDKTVQLKPGESIKDVPFAPEMVLVPPGKFWMGSKDGEGDSDEHPRHEVTIGYPLLVGKYPVTFDEWDAYVTKASRGGFLGIGGSKPHTPGDQGCGRGRRPVINVSWNDAEAYAAWLSEMTGKTYRLLSEAEWEYACRAGTETAYNFGDTISTDQANYNPNHMFGGGVKGGYRGRTTEVGSFPANAFGLHDMHGNVWEWCEDAWYGSYEGAPADGAARTSAETSLSRVLRGGSWNYRPGSLRSANRYGDRPDYRGRSSGFRLARTLNPTP